MIAVEEARASDRDMTVFDAGSFCDEDVDPFAALARELEICLAEIPSVSCHLHAFDGNACIEKDLSRIANRIAELAVVVRRFIDKHADDDAFAHAACGCRDPMSRQCSPARELHERCRTVRSHDVRSFLFAALLENSAVLRQLLVVDDLPGR